MQIQMKKRGTVILLTFKTLFRHELYINILSKRWIGFQNNAF